MKKTALLGLALLLGGCFGSHEIEAPGMAPAGNRIADPMIVGPDGGMEDAGGTEDGGEACEPGTVLSAAEMMRSTWRVERANCLSRWSVIDIEFRGRTSGAVEISNPSPDYANSLRIEFPRRVREYCTSEDGASFVVSRNRGIELSFECENDGPGTIGLWLVDNCDGTYGAHAGNNRTGEDLAAVGCGTDVPWFKLTRE